ncbi:PepSY domain-containing protein [Sinimarinibacterium thermocellulolyticum]|uniref:PepSY domain-containing protein n=1 Tax=Sinimarinibacterium thermocellulolyticum TaxID=3170016 RepID=A0ABV2ABS9_9GAMM
MHRCRMLDHMIRPSPRPPLLATCAGALLLPLAAGGDGDHDRLRSALARDELVSMRSIFDWITQRYDGRIVEVELEDDDGLLVYEVDLLTAEGQKIEFEFDARDGALIAVKGRAIPTPRAP